MSLAAEYLEAVKLDQLADEFRQAGYKVRLKGGGDETQYDLVAEQGDRKIAVEVVARLNTLDETAALRVSALREHAHNQGFNEFRLVLVSPPRETMVEVEGLETLLSNAIVNDIPSELDSLSSHTRVLGISDIDITSTTIGRDGIQVAGTGVVLVELEYSGGEERDGLNEEIDFPFSFDLALTQALELVHGRGSPCLVNLPSGREVVLVCRKHSHVQPSTLFRDRVLEQVVTLSVDTTSFYR